MATIAQQKDEDNKANPTGGPTSVANTGGAGSGGQTGQGGAATVSPVQQNAATQNQSGYTDVASYLNANQGGSQKLGESVASNLTNKYNDTKSGVDKSYGDFSGAVNKGYVPENSDLINQVAANPTAAAGNSDTLSQFQSQLNDTYSGPSSWGDYGTQQGKVDAANQYAGLANTPGGLNIYSQEVEGQTGGPQSQGINQLDTLLLGGSPDAVGQIQNAAKPYQSLNDYIHSQNTAGMGQIKDAQTSASNASQHALDAFTGANGTLTNLNSAVNNQASDALSKAQAQNDSIKQALQGVYSQPLDNTASSITQYGGGQVPWLNSTNYDVKGLSPDVLSSLGLSAEQGQALQAQLQRAGTSQYMTGHNFGAASPTSQIDLGQFLQQQDPSKAINASTTATPEQYAQTQAIQQLLGSKTPQNMALNPALASLAGTAPKSYSQFNYDEALGTAQNTADQARQMAQDEANQLTAGANAAHDASKSHTLGQSFMNNIGKPLAKYAVNPLAAVKDEFSATQTGFNKAKGKK